MVDQEDFRLVTLDRLRQNEVLRFPLRDETGVLLLAEGSLLTARALDLLRQRGIRNILVHREESAAAVVFEPRGTQTDVPPFRPGVKVPIHTASSRRLDRNLLNHIASAVRKSEPPFLASLPQPGATPYPNSLVQELCHSHERNVSRVRGIIGSVIGNQTDGEPQARQLVESYLGLMVQDLDLFTCVASAPFGTQYPQRHSLHVAMLSLAVGVHAGLSETDLYYLALGAMLHDVGMLRVHKSIWAQKNRLTAAQMYSVMEHPLYTIDALENNPQIPDEVRYVCYQVHERVGGQGYPRRLPGDLIHPLAKIVALTDTYLAMVSDRPHRPAILPYIAMETLLRKANSGWFDLTATRWLLETLSLYPVGSYVRLKDRRLAKVVRSNGPDFVRPVVRVWAERTPPTDDTGELIDLCQHPDLAVVEALPAPPAK